MADEWVLAPAELTQKMRAAIFDTSLGTLANDWQAALSARPPIPRPVWDRMVERGAREELFFLIGKRMEASTYDKARIDAALRAALNNPRVEGDEG